MKTVVGKLTYIKKQVDIIGGMTKYDPRTNTTAYKTLGEKSAVDKLLKFFRKFGTTLTTERKYSNWRRCVVESCIN